MLDRQIVQVVVAAVFEEAFEEELVLQRFCVVGQIAGGLVDVGERLLQVGAGVFAILVLPKCGFERGVDLLARLVEILRCGLGAVRVSSILGTS